MMMIKFTWRSRARAQATLGESDKQSTDTHFRAENGIGSFNWRMKFDVTLPARGEGVGYLYLQARGTKRSHEPNKSHVSNKSHELTKP